MLSIKANALNRSKNKDCALRVPYFWVTFLYKHHDLFGGKKSLCDLYFFSCIFVFRLCIYFSVCLISYIYIQVLIYFRLCQLHLVLIGGEGGFKSTPPHYSCEKIEKVMRLCTVLFFFDWYFWRYGHFSRIHLSICYGSIYPPPPHQNLVEIPLKKKIRSTHCIIFYCFHK